MQDRRPTMLGETPGQMAVFPGAHALDLAALVPGPPHLEQPDVDAQDVGDAELAPLGETFRAPVRRRPQAAVRDGRGSENAVALYLAEISRVPLLAAAQEIALATRIATGVQAAAALSQAGLDAATRARHERVAADGRRARAELIQANLRLVVSMAKRYAGRGMSLLDLIQEGNVGLIHAVEKFDPQRGYRFSTYATWWIRQAITRGLADQGRMVRIPAHTMDLCHRVLGAAERLTQEQGREPTLAEIGARVGLAAARVGELLRAVQEPISLQTPVGESGHWLSDLVADNVSPLPGDTSTGAQLRDELAAALGRLSSRERAVIERRFGLSDGRRRTLEEVGQDLTLTRERIRQIEGRALYKLRCLSASRRLQTYLE